MSEDIKNQGYHNDKNNRRGKGKNKFDKIEKNENDQALDANKQAKKVEDNRNQFNRQPNRIRNKDFKKIKVEETIEDIEKDIARIEKEIDLEIKEIMALKLGL